MQTEFWIIYLMKHTLRKTKHYDYISGQMCRRHICCDQEKRNERNTKTNSQIQQMFTTLNLSIVGRIYIIFNFNVHQEENKYMKPISSCRMLTSTYNLPHHQTL